MKHQPRSITLAALKRPILALLFALAIGAAACGNDLQLTSAEDVDHQPPLADLVPTNEGSDPNTSEGTSTTAETATPVPTLEPAAGSSKPGTHPPVEPTAAPAQLPVPDPKPEPTQVPVVEPTPAPTTIPPVVEPTPAPPTPEPTPQPTPVPPVVQPTPVPPTPEPIPEPIPDPDNGYEANLDPVFCEGVSQFIGSAGWVLSEPRDSSELQTAIAVTWDALIVAQSFRGYDANIDGTLIDGNMALDTIEWTLSNHAFDVDLFRANATPPEHESYTTFGTQPLSWAVQEALAWHTVSCA